jgi:hypothetical protein
MGTLVERDRRLSKKRMNGRNERTVKSSQSYLQPSGNSSPIQLVMNRWLVSNMTDRKKRVPPRLRERIAMDQG